MFKTLVILLAICVCTVCCHIDGDNGGTSDVDHQNQFNHDHVDDDHNNQDEHSSFEDVEDDDHYDQDGFQSHDPLNNYYKPQNKAQHLADEYDSEDPHRGSPNNERVNDITYKYNFDPPSKLPTIDENHVLADDAMSSPVQQPNHQATHQLLRERIGSRLSRTGSSTGRKSGDAHNTARPKLDSLRVDLKDHAASLRNNPKVIRGIEAVSRKKASLKGKLLSLKSRHEMRKAERLQNQQHQPTGDGDMDTAYDSPNPIPMDSNVHNAAMPKVNQNSASSI